MRNQNQGFDFAQKPSIGSQIADGFTSIFGDRKTQTKKDSIAVDYDRVIYFKTERFVSGMFQEDYLVFYTDGGFVPNTFSLSQLKEMVQKRKGYIGYTSRYNEKTNSMVKGYTIVGYDRAHSYPRELNWEFLINHNLVIPVETIR